MKFASLRDLSPVIRYFQGVIQALAIGKGACLREKFQNIIRTAEINPDGMKTVGEEETDEVQHVDRISHGLLFCIKAAATCSSEFPGRPLDDARRGFRFFVQGVGRCVDQISTL